MPRSARPLGPVGHGPGTARADTPVLVRHMRNGIEESVHRGDIVEADASGRLIRSLGDPDRVVTLRSTVKPFGLVALIEAGGIEAFDLEPAEIAIMASSHSGEDFHVRTLQGMFRRAGVSQSMLACGNEGMPLDALTAARLARDGEKPGPIRHMCSGQHAVSLLLSRLKGWDLETYWEPEHPSQVVYRAAVARAYGTTPDRLADRDRWLRRRDLRVPPSRGRPGVRVPGRAIGRAAAGPAQLDRARAHDRPRRDRRRTRRWSAAGTTGSIHRS